MLECRKEREGENMRKLLLSELMSKSGGRRCPITSECDLRPLAFRGHELTLRVKSRSLLAVSHMRWDVCVEYVFEKILVPKNKTSKTSYEWMNKQNKQHIGI